jgi:Na+/melibiose symporter-like transporter
MVQPATQPQLSGAATVPGPTPAGAALAGRWRGGLSYGGLGAPLAFAALPLYVQLPSHYAATLGAPLAGLGLVLLATRAWDAYTDPWLGRGADHLLKGPQARTWRWAVLAGLLLAAGLVAVFFPPSGSSPTALLAWCAAALVVTSLGYSGLGVLHQAWGARLGGGAAAQARIVGWREGLALAGVLVASVLPAVAGVPAMVATGVVLLAISLLLLRWAPYPAGSAAAPSAAEHAIATAPAQPWRQPAFRKLLAVFLVNGVASAVPATLVLFYIRDRLQAPAFEPLFLAAYFTAAGLAVPLWVRAVARHGLVRCWLASMVLAVASFCWAALLGPGDVLAFTVVCLASGLALGADLVVPGALLTGVIQAAGHGQGHEGRYFGWWTCAAKLNLAVAAGLALPLLQALGYQPGSQAAPALWALTVAYAVLPCVLKLAALLLLWHHRNFLENPCATPRAP